MATSTWLLTREGCNYTHLVGEHSTTIRKGSPKPVRFILGPPHVQVPFLLCSKFAEYDKARPAKSVQWLCYRLDHMGSKSWQRQESYPFSETFRPDLGPTRLLFKSTGGYFPGAMWLVHWDHQSPPSTAKVKNEWSYTTTPPNMHSQNVQGQLFLFFHCTFSFPSFYTQIKYTIHKYISKYDVHYTAFHHSWRQWKGKAIPLQAWTGPESSRRLRLPDFKTIGTKKVVRLSVLHTGRLYPPGNIPGTHFCKRLSRPQGP